MELSFVPGKSLLSSSLIVTTWQFRSSQSLQMGGPGPRTPGEGGTLTINFCISKVHALLKLVSAPGSQEQDVYTPEIYHGTKKSPIWEGKSSSKPSLFGFKMLIFQGVDIWPPVIFSLQKIWVVQFHWSTTILPPINFYLKMIVRKLNHFYYTPKN